MKRALVVIGLVVFSVAAYAGGGKDSGPVAVLNFLVLRDYNGKPVRNAAVVVHSVGKNDKQERGGIELKTDAEGKCSFEGAPYGKLRVQVLAPGFQTTGQDFDVEQPTLDVTIKLKRPGGQYSIYDDHTADKDKNPAPPSDEKK
jgi:hypothetical protein